MATPPELGRDRYEQVTATIRAIIEQIQAVWRTLSAESIEDDLMGEAGATIAAAAISGQASVADAAAAYIAAQMVAQGASPIADAALLVQAFTGAAPGAGRWSPCCSCRRSAYGAASLPGCRPKRR